MYPRDPLQRLWVGTVRRCLGWQWLLSALSPARRRRRRVASHLWLRHDTSVWSVVCRLCRAALPLAVALPGARSFNHRDAALRLFIHPAHQQEARTYNPGVSERSDLLILSDSSRHLSCGLAPHSSLVLQHARSSAARQLGELGELGIHTHTATQVHHSTHRGSCACQHRHEHDRGIHGSTPRHTQVSQKEHTHRVTVHAPVES